jgi:hypothetical protein
MASRESATEDEYIAQLLAKEAKEASKKYSELGVRALLPTRSAGYVPSLRPELIYYSFSGPRQLPRNQTQDS